MNTPGITVLSESMLYRYPPLPTRYCTTVTSDVLRSHRYMISAQSSSFADGRIMIGNTDPEITRRLTRWVSMLLSHFHRSRCFCRQAYTSTTTPGVSYTLLIQESATVPSRTRA